MGLQALAAMRQALRGFSSRERPVANRIVLYVGPPWRIPRESWPTLAESFVPLADGVGLEKVGASGPHPGARRSAARLGPAP